MSVTMPNSGRYPCDSCNYVAVSRRMLSRHTTIAHASQAFKCPLCPFVSCYQANLYRHKRDIHGLGRVTACEICGFFASSVEELIQHKDNNHQDQIEWLKKKYANERIRLGVESKEVAIGGHNEEKLFVNTNSNVSKDYEAGTSHTNRGLPDELAVKDSSIEMGTRQLSPLKIRRSYVCNECGLTTIDPREYLYHRRDIHGERMTIHECKSCVYASRHVQKLQRHYTLVHHKSMEEDEDEFINAANNSSPKNPTDSNIPKANNENLDDYEFKDESANKSKPLHRKSTARKSVIKVLKCSECPFQTQNNIVLLQHEKEAHKKKKFYHCMQCGYGTNNKSRFTRHLKYHALPKLKCEYCDFKSAYKWNMDRHMKNHMEQGEFECNKCSFTTNTKQSLTVHLDYHHGNSIHPKSRKYNLETSSDLSMEQFVMQDDSRSHSSADDDSDSFENAETFDVGEDKTLDNINYSEDFYEDERDDLSKHEYKYKRNSESAKKHCCPICDAQFPQLSAVGQHLKDEHSESVEANNIAVVVDMLTPRRKTRNGMESSVERQRETSGSFPRMQEREKTRLEPTCNICGYKTRWTSEMIKHQRVHSGEKPFECNVCNYKCRWKGDLTRHFEKFHKQRMPTPEFLSLDKMKVAQDENSSAHHSASVDVTRDSMSSDQDGPLDLTIANKIEKSDDFLAKSNYLKINHKLISTRESLALKRKLEYDPPLATPPSKVLVKKYQCTYCGFMTKTASRFHVHIVQHFNKRPFVCSICGYRSNWQWDITKHIKMKAIRDNSHSDATVLITDETGNKNYDKYKQYLVEVEERKDGRAAEKQDLVPSEGTNKRRRIHDDDDESMASGIAEPENIVVTPDLPFSLEENSQANSAAVLADQRQKAFRKFFYCKHCPLKHQEKKFVVSHLAVHAGIKLFYCKLCDFSTNWRHVILRHIRLSHNGDLELLESRVTYTTEGRIIGITDIKKEHWVNENTVSRPKPIGAALRCEICPYSCQKEAHMKVHMKQHRPRDGANLKCMFCPYYVKFRKTLILHLELHKTSDDASNTEDNKIRNADSANCSANSYREANESENIDNVAFTFENLNNLSNRKKRLLLGKKKHVCEQCPYQTENKTQYLYHKQFHRPNKAAKYKCKLCSYWATHQHLMSQHLKVHNINKSYTLIGIDPESNKLVHSSQEVDENNGQIVGSNQQSNQIQPVIVKKGDVYFRMYKCSYCPMMNKRRANVRIHQKMHLKSKLTKYSCPLCNYKCNNQGIISAHMKIHGKDITDAIVNNPSSHGDIELMRTNTEESAKKKIFNYFCMKCPAVFKTSADMQIHKTFHGALYPYQCPHCDYRAKHKPHLHKHLLVHTPEYIAKREISHGPPVVANIVEGGTVARTSEANQMMLLEEAEMKAVMAGTVTKRPYKLHRCTFCPAMFFKSTTLQYHTSLHKSNGLFRCSRCDYAVDSKINLMTHDKLHAIQPRKPKSKQVPGFMCCPKCPAMFNKVDRFHRHLRLHGQSNKYTCEHCDYSVQLQANLFNHKVVHTKSYADRKRDVNIVSSELAFSADHVLLFENVKVLEENDNKPYMCDRCPYHHPRKETVQNHQKYHNSNEGMKCPYCDYFSSQPLFMRDHIKVHFQTETPVQPQGFTKNENVEIWCVVDGKREMLFRDRGANVFKSVRFFPLAEETEQHYANRQCHSNPVLPKDVSTLNVPTEQASLDTKEANTTENLIPNCLSNDKPSSEIGRVLGDKEEFVVISQSVFLENKTTALNNEEIRDECDVKLSTINGTNGNLPYENTGDAEDLCIIEDDDNFIRKSDLLQPNSMELSEKSEEFIVEEEDESISTCHGTLSSVQENLYGGTNNNNNDNSNFNADNEELRLNLNNYYFDTSKDNAAANIANVVELEWRTDEASEQVITDVMISEGCEQIGEPEMEVGGPASDDPSSSMGREAFADSSAEEGCNRSELMSETDGNILSEVSIQM